MSTQKRRREEGSRQGDSRVERSDGQDKRAKDSQSWRGSGRRECRTGEKEDSQIRGRGESGSREDSHKRNNENDLSKLEEKRRRREETKSGSDETASDEETPREVLSSHRRHHHRSTQGHAEEEEGSKALVVRKDCHPAVQGRRADERDWGPRQSMRGKKGKNSSNPELTIFVGDLDLSVSPADLKEAFSLFGEITNVKVIPTQCYGFVTFSSKSGAQAAHEAEQSSEGIVIRGQRVRVRQACGALPSWKVGAGGFSFSANNGLPESPPILTGRRPMASLKSLGLSSPVTGNPRDTFQAAAIAAAVTAGAVLYAGGGNVPEEAVHQAAGGRQVVAYDDLF